MSSILACDIIAYAVASAASREKFLLTKNAMVICEHSPKQYIQKSTLWETIDVRDYGQSRLTFLINVQHP